MNVTKLRVTDWDKKDGSPIVKVTNVTLEDGHEVPGYDLPPGIEPGKPLPDGWEVATGKSGKPYIKVPKPRGTGKGRDYVPRYADTEAGWREADERIDRRRALELAQASETGIVTELATKFYEWLRETASTRSALIPPGDVAADGPVPPLPVTSSGDRAITSSAAGSLDGADDGETAANGDDSHGEGGTTSGVAAVSHNYLSKDDQALLKGEFGTGAKALLAYKRRFGERINNLGDITYEMRDQMMEVSA